MTGSPLQGNPDPKPARRRGLSRRVYEPPAVEAGWTAALLGALAITLAVFLVLPLTQMISSRVHRQLILTRVDAAVLAPPAPEEPPPAPPPQEEPPEETPPQLGETAPPLNFAIPDLDFAVGTGGVLPGSGFPSEGALDAAGQINAFDVSDLDQAPAVISSVSPRYPRELLRARVEGTVVLLFLVDESGRVHEPRVESATHPAFEQPALEALRRWKFRPGSREGTQVKTFMRLPMRYRINH